MSTKAIRELEEDASALSARALLNTIFHRYQYDFRSYALNSLLRRLELARIQLGCVDLDELEQKILCEPTAFAAALKYLTVQVSDLFRDPAYYRVLRERVVPILAAQESVKVWIAGCSTGEEVHSFTILFHEEGLLDRTVFYATDIHPEALRTAEIGIYPDERLPTFEEQYRLGGGKARLSDYYVRKDGFFAFERRLRRRVAFSAHSLATDGVFTEVDLVSCRNVLIYFDTGLQDRSYCLLRDALRSGGFLGLGTKETPQFSLFAPAFEPFAPEESWYRRR